MKQRKVVSGIEVVLNTASGFIVAMLIWRVLAQYLGYPMDIETNLFITTIFTVASVVRGYFWRRYFNNIGDKLYEKLYNSRAYWRIRDAIVRFFS